MNWISLYILLVTGMSDTTLYSKILLKMFSRKIAPEKQWTLWKSFSSSKGTFLLFYILNSKKLMRFSLHCSSPCLQPLLTSTYCVSDWMLRVNRIYQVSLIIIVWTSSSSATLNTVTVSNMSSVSCVLHVLCLPHRTSWCVKGRQAHKQRHPDG